MSTANIRGVSPKKSQSAEGASNGAHHCADPKSAPAGRNIDHAFPAKYADAHGHITAAPPRARSFPNLGSALVHAKLHARRRQCQGRDP